MRYPQLFNVFAGTGWSVNIFRSLIPIEYFVFKHWRATIEAVCLNAGTVWEFRGCEFYDVFTISLKHDSGI
jgi:hypothetical protein